jgi:dihydrofolate reductase
MRKLIVFNSVSVDGYFVDKAGDMSWAHSADPEFDAFTQENAKGGGTLLFGRITYELMASYWPTPMAAANDPVVADGMNKLPKVVFSRTMERAEWNNTRLVKKDLIGEVRTLKREAETDLVIMGSGSIVSKLAQGGLIDEYQLIVVPVALGGGRTLFEGMTGKLDLKLKSSRVFGSGKVYLCYV